MKPLITAVIFDFGGVMSFSQDKKSVERMKYLLGLSTESFERSYKRHRNKFDSGRINEIEYWLKIAGDNGVLIDMETLSQLASLDLMSWLVINDDMLGFLDNIKARGIKTAVLSNMPFNILKYMEENFKWLNKFDKEIYSCNSGISKPDLEIYEHCLRELSILPENCLYIDDTEANLEPAKELGINVHLFTGIKELCEDINNNYILKDTEEG
jgi:putative hydrolase of the HAD superfamily